MNLILGASGFVGRNFTKYLSELGISFEGISRSTNQDFYDKSYDPDYLNKFKAVVNFVGKVHDVKNVSDSEEYSLANVEHLKKSYNAFIKSDSRVYIYLSSVKAVADVVERELTEDQIPNPVTVYGRTKLKAEQYIIDNLPENRTVIILRPCMIHGPGNKGNLNLLHSIIRRGIPWPLGSFDNNRSFLSIDNLCFVIKEFLEGKLSSGVYNIADDEPLSTNQIVEMISEQLGRKPKILNIPKPIIQFGAKLGNKLPLPLNEERLQKLTENYLVSNKKIVSEIGKPLPVSAKEGMRKTIQSLIEENG